MASLSEGCCPPTYIRGALGMAASSAPVSGVGRGTRHDLLFLSLSPGLPWLPRSPGKLSGLQLAAASLPWQALLTLWVGSATLSPAGPEAPPHHGVHAL